MAGGVTSNLASVVRALQGLPLALSPRRRLPGGRRLGDELADTAAAAVRARTVDRQRDPDDRPLPRLNARYKARKLRQGYDGRILVRTGGMTDPRQLRGEVTVTRDLLVMAAGLDPGTRDKVGWNTRGDRARNRPPRRFYELGRSGKRALDPVLRDARDSAVAEARRLA